MRDDKVPVSIKLLDLKTAEVKGEVTTHRLETKAEFAKVDARFDEISQKFDSKFAESETRSDARFKEFEVRSDAKFAEFETRSDSKFAAFEARSDAKFNEFMNRSDSKFAAFEARSDAKFANYIAHFDARFEELRTLNIKTLATVEEQNSRNRFALDGYTQVYEKLIEMDSRVERIEKHIFGA